MSGEFAERILASRRELMAGLPPLERAEDAAEGGCGVLGFAANVPIAGRHVLQSSRQMHNRGNGKGGGIAMAGLDPAQVRVDAPTLRTHYLLQVALLDPSSRDEVEREFIRNQFDVAQGYELETLDDYREIESLEVRPPDVWRYFVRAKPGVLEAFAAEKGLEMLPSRAVEDEFVYQNSYNLNRRFYASLGEQRAFVLSHGRNLSVLKIVGYAEDVAAYYRLEDQMARVWAAHQRYPTKGRVWHPGGAHPFIGLHEALMHNGDFSNFHAVGEYLRQRNIGQLFLTDTEVSVQLFDLWSRVYGYPLEIVLEAMAPTTEHDFAMLDPQRQRVYQAVQRTHLHASPDGPWFFILVRSQMGEEESEEDRFELLGITDTSMLRPQVFALYENDEAGVQIGLIASERQAINACLRSLSEEDLRFQPYADRYWAARGGSHTDGGAFRFVVRGSGDQASLVTSNKFWEEVRAPAGQAHVDNRALDPERTGASFRGVWQEHSWIAFDDGGAGTFWDWAAPALPDMTWDQLAWGVSWLGDFAQEGDEEWSFAREILTLLRDRRVDTGAKRRASVLGLVDRGLEKIFQAAPPLNDGSRHRLERTRRLTWSNRDALRAPQGAESVLVLDASEFPPEGEQAASRWLSRAYEMGWRHFVSYRWRGGRFAGCGFGPDSDGARLELYGDVGDYAASGLDGMEVHLHGDGQDQLGQILKQGKLVVHGDVGQTFLYGAKGGDVYVLGSAAGRPLINAVGRPRAVINGVCLDYLAESFMAGNPLDGGGFVVLNGVQFDSRGRLVEMESPYPGGNLFSLASGGAVYLRDPHRKVQARQLNGGAFATLSDADWALIEPYLHENERLFGVRVDDLLTVGGEGWIPQDVYRKVVVGDSGALREAANR